MVIYALTSKSVQFYKKSPPLHFLRFLAFKFIKFSHSWLTPLFENIIAFVKPSIKKKNLHRFL
jgi:hypothetical protein